MDHNAEDRAYWDDLVGPDKPATSVTFKDEQNGILRGEIVFRLPKRPRRDWSTHLPDRPSALLCHPKKPIRRRILRKSRIESDRDVDDEAQAMEKTRYRKS